MIPTLLFVRFKQLGRILQNVGFFYVLFISVCYFLLHLALYSLLQTSNSNTAYTLTTFLLIGMASLHIGRKDRKFLKSLYGFPYFIYFSEYLLLLLPIIIIFLLSSYWHIGILLVVGLCLISFMQAEQLLVNKETTYKKSVIPVVYFEWIRGFRLYKYPILLLYFLGLSLSFYLFAIPICWLLINLFVFSFYDTGEPIQLISLPELAAKKFLKKKMKEHLLLYSYGCISFLLVFLVFHIQYWYIVLLLYGVSIFLLLYTILVKYSFYEPNQKNAGQIWMTIGILSLFIPFLVPLPLLMCVRFYKRSITNLSTYLDVYH